MNRRIILNDDWPLDATDNIAEEAARMMGRSIADLMITPPGLETRRAADYDMLACEEAEVPAEEYDDLPEESHYSVGLA